MQQWRLTQGRCATEGAEYCATYGVATTLPTGDEWEWPDVDVDRGVVQTLVDRLQATQPEPCHFTDMVLDFIEETAGKV